jgi:hypothetical protein
MTYSTAYTNCRVLIPVRHMTGPEMVKYINELSSSIREQSATGNLELEQKFLRHRATHMASST